MLICLKNNSLGATFIALTTFGENLKRLREGAELSGVELAARLDVGASQVSKWETGRTGLPEGPTLLKLAKVLRCLIDDLLDGIDAEYDRLRAQILTVRTNAGQPITASDAELLERWLLLREPLRDSFQKSIWELTEEAIRAKHASQIA